MQEKLTNQSGISQGKKTETQMQEGSSQKFLQLAEIKGRISVAQSSDYRAISAIAEKFAASINNQPGFQLVALRLPFEISAEKSLQGMIGVDRATSPSEFALTLAKIHSGRAVTAAIGNRNVTERP